METAEVSNRGPGCHACARRSLSCLVAESRSGIMTIRAVLIFNNYGNPRITKFYSQLPTDRQQALIQLIFQLVSRRDDKTVCNFLDAPELTPFLPPPATDAWTRAANEDSRNAPNAVAASQEQAKSHADDDGHDPWISYSSQQAAPSTKPKRRWRPDDELRVIYRHYATLYFVLVVDQSESELGILDLIQVCSPGARYTNTAR